MPENLPIRRKYLRCLSKLYFQHIMIWKQWSVYGPLVLFMLFLYHIEKTSSELVFIAFVLFLKTEGCNSIFSLKVVVAIGHSRMCLLYLIAHQAFAFCWMVVVKKFKLLLLHLGHSIHKKLYLGHHQFSCPHALSNFTVIILVMRLHICCLGMLMALGYTIWSGKKFYVLGLMALWLVLNYGPMWHF